MADDLALKDLAKIKAKKDAKDQRG